MPSILLEALVGLSMAHDSASARFLFVVVLDTFDVDGLCTRFRRSVFQGAVKFATFGGFADDFSDFVFERSDGFWNPQ